MRQGFPGVLIDGTFWYWDALIDGASIARRRAIARLHRVERGVAAALAGACGVLFVVGVVTTFATDLFDVAFWTTPNAFLAAFWFGLLALAFFGYRMFADRDLVRTIPRHQQPPEYTAVASLEAASQRAPMSFAFDTDATKTIEDAFELARGAQHAEVTALHVFAASLSSQDVRVFFARLGLTLAVVRDPIRRRFAAMPAGETVFGVAATELAAKAFALAASAGRKQVTALELVSVAYEGDEFLQELFDAAGVDAEAVRATFTWLRITDLLRERYATFRKAASFKPTGNMNRAYTAVATPFLDSVSEDLTRDAVYGRANMLIGRDDEMATILRAIEGGNQSVVLVGSPGVGKAALVDGIAERMVEERVPGVLQDKRLLKLSIPLIVSAHGGSGAEERLLMALREVAASGNVVLIIENVHELVGVGSGVDLSSILASELEKGYTFVIATTTPQAYAESVERSVLGPKLQRIPIAEPERQDAIAVLSAHVGAIEGKHRAVFTYQALAACVDYAIRYLHDGSLPESAIELAKEAALEASKRPSDAHGLGWVRKEDVATLVSSRTKIPVSDVGADEGQRLLQLESRLHERVIGQDIAVKAVAAALRRARTELRSTNRPIANFLFLGSTGVGKTELAKATAEVYFGNESSMVRFDMSEYQDQASVTRLIGGNGQAGLLTEAIRRAPFSLLLLDELEKAHPDILNLFLQVMDDGRLTDGLGRTVDFTNAIIIATSNAGTQFIQDEVAKGSALDAIKTALLEHELRTTYRPEFLNRFDDVIVFSPLSMDDVAAIAYLLIGKVIERLKAKGIDLTVTDAAIHELARAGFDPKYGARPLRRVVQEKLENAIAEKILGGEVGRRDSLVYDQGGALSVEKAKAL